MHHRMQNVLTSLISEELARIVPGGGKVQIPNDLIARHIASTFVLVLNWWVENNQGLTATDVDACFRKLVMPTLTRFFAQLA